MATETIPTEIEAFRRARFEAVTGPTGDAALIGTHWITEPTEIEGFPGRWDLVSDDPTRLHYVAPTSGIVTSDGTQAAGNIVVASATQGGAILTYGSARRATALYWPGLGMAVRVWDADAATDVVAIETYPYDARWRVEGVYAPHERKVNYEYHGHGGRLEGRHVVGEVTLTHGDREVVLMVTQNASGLTAVFGDATNARETYGGGRFVQVVALDDGRAIVDFNKATLPPCAFSPYFDCPLPPPQNVIKGPVPAGEKRIVRR